MNEATMTIPVAQLRRGMVCVGGLGSAGPRRTITRVVQRGNEQVRWEYRTQFGDEGVVRMPLRLARNPGRTVQVLL